MLTLHIIGGFLLVTVVIARFLIVARYRKPLATLRPAILGLCLLQIASGAALIFANAGIVTRVCASAFITIAALLTLEYALRRVVRAQAKQTQMLH